MRDGNKQRSAAPTKVSRGLNEGWPECGMETDNSTSAIEREGRV